MRLMFSVVIPMAGLGARAELNMNKAFKIIGKKPLFMYAYDVFKSFDCEIILVVKESEKLEALKYAPEAKIAYGGETRAQSVENGVKIASCEKVLIHDAARPFITKEIIERALKSLENNRCSYVGVKSKDTVRSLDTGLLDRDRIIIVQTPQCGYKDDFIEAFKKGVGDTLTDDVAYLEKYLGLKPYLVEGDDLNIKLTRPGDFVMAQNMLKEE